MGWDTTWSWNPLTDISEAGHNLQQGAGDVLGKIPGANWTMSKLNAPYTALISRPISTAVGFLDNEDYKQQTGQSAPISDLWSTNAWRQAWDNSETMSPGQAITIAGNSFLQSGNQNPGIASTLLNGGTLTPAQLKAGNGPNPNLVDPYNQNARDQFFASNSTANVVSGGIDLGYRALDPASALTKAIREKATIASNAPIRGDMTPQDVITRPDVQSFLDGVSGKTFTQLATDPRFKASPVGYKAAALMTASKSRDAVQNLYSIALGDTGSLANLMSDRDLLANKIDALNQLDPFGPELSSALALSRAQAILAPLETDLKSGVSDLNFPDLLNAQGKTGMQVAQHARQVLISKAAELNGAKAIAGQMTQRTRVGPLAGRVAGTKAALSIANAREGNPFSHSVYQPSNRLTTITDHVADPIIRIYQSLTEPWAGKAVDFTRDDSVNNVRAMLNTFSALDPATKDAMLARYARADQGARQLTFNQIEQQALKATADRWGVHPEHAEALYSTFTARRATALQAVNNKVFGTLDHPALGDKLGPLAPTGNDSHVVSDAYLMNQLSRGAIPALDGRDLDLALQRSSETGITRAAHTMGHAGAGFLLENLDKAYGLWKGLTLITGHRAYNHVGDDLLRTMSMLGSMATVENFSGGAANFLRNRITQITRSQQVRNAQAAFDTSVNDATSTWKSLQARNKGQKDLISKGATFAPANMTTDAMVQAAKDALDALKAKGPAAIPPPLRLGTGVLHVPGTRIVLPELYGGPDGDYNRQIFSGDNTFKELFQSEAEGHFNSLNVLADHDVIGPTDPAGNVQPKVHANAILRYVKNQLGPDPVTQRLLAGMSENDIRDWMLKTADGQQLMRNLHLGEPLNHINFIRDMIGTYLTSDQSKDAALNGRYSMKNLEQDFPAPSLRPAVIGNMALMNHLGSPSAGYIRAVTSKMIRWTGALPDDVLVRHPMAATLYKTNLIEAVGRVIAQTDKDHMLTPDELRMVQRTSMDATRKTMKETLYDSSRFVSAGHTLRFLSPFFNAWHNAMSSWTHLIAQNPQLILRGWQAKQALWNSPAAIDVNTGKPPTSATGINDMALVMHLPAGVANMLGMTDDNYIPIAASTLLSPTYADSVLNPGAGPLVVVPVNHMVKNDPGLLSNPFVQTILGGRVSGNDFAQAIPSSVTQARDIGGLLGITGSPDNVASRASLQWTLYQEQYYDYLNGKRSSPPNWNDVTNQASWLSAFDGIVNRIMPLGFKPRGNHQMLIDEYHSMESADPKNAQQNFWDKYGNAGFVFTQSLSSDPGGVPATTGAAQAYQRYLPLIKQFPELAAVVIGPEGDGSFNAMADQWEVANGLRTYMTPEQAATKEQVNLGWQQYSKLMSNINAQLAERGLVSTNQSGASDLKSLKTAYESATSDPNSRYYNPDWYSAFGGYNQNAYDQRVQALEKIAQDPALLANPVRSDIQSLNAYFQFRGIAQGLLAIRPSKSLKAVGNQDVANWLDYHIGVLEQSDTKFSALYSSYLKNDDLKLP